MAAKKFSRRQLSTHADERKAPARQRRTSRPRRRSGERMDRQPIDRAAQNRSEIVRLLAEALAVLQTIRMAMREFEEHPTFGNVCVAFNQAMEALGRAHSEVGRLLERRT